MKTTLLLLAVSVSAQLSAQSIPTSSNLPILIINTNGQTIADDPKVMADMGIIYNGQGIRNNITDPFNHYLGKVGIEFRGNSSQIALKKSFGLETRNPDSTNFNVSLLGLPKENDWVLYNSHDDETYMRNVLTYDLARQTGHYASRTVFVELFITSDASLQYADYRGIYVLAEKIKRDKNRVDISKLEYKDSTGNDLTGGYIVKIDHHVGNPGPIWASQYTNECGDYRTDFELHEPKDEDIHPNHLTYIQNFLHTFESALDDPAFADTALGYRKYADVPSFIDYFLLSEVVRSADAYSNSTYLHKNRDSKGGKLVMGPMWDYNSSTGNTPYNFCAANDTTGWQYQSQRLCRVDRKQPFWWKRLLDDPAYVAEVQARWNVLRADILKTSRIVAMIDSNRSIVAEAQPRDYTRWNVAGEHGTFSAEISYLKVWWTKRLAWMDRNVPRLGNYVHTAAATPPPITCEQPVRLSAYTGKQLTYQWKLNGNPLPGATGSDITATKPGSYAVDVTLATDCYTETLVADPLGRVVESVQSGDWDVSATWSCQTIPTSLDSVVIQAAHLIEIPQTVQANAASVALEMNAKILQRLSASLMFGN